jgi:hypothetical protein
MKKVPFLAQVLDRLRLKRQSPPASSTRPMSDRELALTLRELQRCSAAEREQMRISRMAELRRRGQTVKQQDACSAKRADGALSTALEVLRRPVPDTFLGRRTQTPFPKEGEA